MTLIGHISPNSACTNRYCSAYLATAGSGLIHAERAGAMAHGVKLEIAERDFLHFAVGRMIIDPVLVAAEPVARIQHRRVLVGDPRQFIKPAASERAEAIEMRLQPAKIIRLQVEPEQVAQAAIDRVEILSRAIRRDVIGAGPVRRDLLGVRGVHGWTLRRVAGSYAAL